MTLLVSLISAPSLVVNVTSDQPNPIRPIGSNVTLTCTVVLAEYVERLTLNTVWTGPNGFSENGIAQRMGSTTTYTSTAMVSSFGRDHSGNYNCTATVSSTSSSIDISTKSSSTRVTVGKRNRVVLSKLLMNDTHKHVVCACIIIMVDIIASYLRCVSLS